jgi:hypothetical protein
MVPVAYTYHKLSSLYISTLVHVCDPEVKFSEKQKIKSLAQMTFLSMTLSVFPINRG